MNHNQPSNSIERDNRSYVNFLRDRLTCAVLMNERLEKKLDHERFLRRLFMSGFIAAVAYSILSSLAYLI